MQHLLLLHGAMGSKKQLDALAKKLENNFTVHTLNFSGHGGNNIPNIFSIELFSDDIFNYLKENNIEQINIFGYSMGGYVALYFAKKNRNRINKIFTLATKFLWTPEIASKEIKMLNPEKIEEKLPEFASTLFERHQPENWKMVLEKTKEMMIELGNNNVLKKEDYSQIENNLLIGIGDKDTMVTIEETIDVYRNLKNASFIVFPNTPHPIEKVDLNRLSNEIKTYFG